MGQLEHISYYIKVDANTIYPRRFLNIMALNKLK